MAIHASSSRSSGSRRSGSRANFQRQIPEKITEAFILSGETNTIIMCGWSVRSCNKPCFSVLLPHSCGKQDCSELINSVWMAASRQRLVGTNAVWSAIPVTNPSLPDFNDARHFCGPDVSNKNRLINHTNAVKAAGLVFIRDKFSCNVEIRDVMFAAACRPTLGPT